jgi:hypothetical protein
MDKIPCNIGQNNNNDKYNNDGAGCENEKEIKIC